MFSQSTKYWLIFIIPLLNQFYCILFITIYPWCVCVCNVVHIYIHIYFMYIKQPSLLYWTIQVKLMPMHVCHFAKFCADWDLNHCNHIGSAVKNLPAKAGDVGRAPGGGNGKPLQHSCLGYPMDREAWWDTVHRVTSESDTTVRLNNINKP